MSDCTKLFAQAQTLIPGGVNSPVRAFRAVGGTPRFFESGQGAYLHDIEGQSYIDYVGSWGCLILGHAHPDVIAAVQASIQKGLGFGAPTTIEVQMAEIITQCIPSIEQVRMVSSGTEATQSAIRLARGYTKRSKILKFQGCYHGHSDGLLVKAGSGLLSFGIPDSAGIPEAIAQYTLVAPYNDLGAVETIFHSMGSDIAAVIVEPIAANMNCLLPVPGFLEGLRLLCDQYQSCLIFDEVITGFRVALGGAQSLYEITPDLTCVGKIVGGGLPVAAFGGRQAIMDYLAPDGPVYQAGTLSGNPVTLSAGLATLEILRQAPPYAMLAKRTEAFCRALKSQAHHYGIPLQTQAAGSLFGLLFSEDPEIHSYEQVLACNTARYRAFFHGMLQEGVYFAPSAFESGFTSIAHTESILEQTLEAAARVFQILK